MNMSSRIENISADCAILGYDEGLLKILLIKRDKEPALNNWSLPGAYVNLDETIDNAAQRILKELTGIHHIYLSQVGVFDQTNRYPTHRVISILYCALVKPEHFNLLAGSHAKEVQWFSIHDIKELPFDHNIMIERALIWLKDELWRKPILINLLPDKFPLNQMLDLYETILQSSIDNRNFRKKVINQGLVERLEEKTKGGKQRPAYLYKLKIPL